MGAQQVSASANIELLDTVFICRSCGIAYIFRSDVHDHKLDTGHKDYNEIQLDVYCGEENGDHKYI